jgi:hypothetical protein
MTVDSWAVEAFMYPLSTKRYKKMSKPDIK